MDRAGVAVPPSAADAEASYYQAVEEYFVSRRGDPLFLSNADWLLIRRWRSEGVPLRVVLRGVGDALDGHAHSWSRTRKVGSLAYCRAEVERAAERWRRALSLGEEPGTGLAEALLGFAAGLDASRGLGPRAAAGARALAGRLREWAAATPDLRELEPALSAAERRLVEALTEEDGPEAAAADESAVDGELAPYSGRMPEKVLAQVRRESLARRVLARHGLPRLTLLSL